MIDEFGFEKLERKDIPDALSLLVMALLDRVVDSSIIIKFDGKSYRAERAEQKQRST